MWLTLISAVAGAVTSIVGALMAQKHASNASDCADRAEAANRTQSSKETH